MENKQFTTITNSASSQKHSQIFRTHTTLNYYTLLETTWSICYHNTNVSGKLDEKQTISANS